MAPKNGRKIIPIAAVEALDWEIDHRPAATAVKKKIKAGHKPSRGPRIIKTIQATMSAKGSMNKNKIGIGKSV